VCFVEGAPAKGFVGAYPPAAIGEFLDGVIAEHTESLPVA
jgi:thioredoxin-like negative regulator of GroEL